jgi:hypothetical protein
MGENLVVSFADRCEAAASSFVASNTVSIPNKQFESGLGQTSYHLTEKLLTVSLSN